MRIKYCFKETQFSADIDFSNIRSIRYELQPKSGKEQFDHAKIIIRLKTPGRFGIKNMNRFQRCVSPFSAKNIQLDEQEALILAYWNLDQTFFLDGKLSPNVDL